MNRAITLLLILLFSHFSFGQTDEEKAYTELYKKTLDSLLNEYRYKPEGTEFKSQVISPDLLSENLRNAFNTVAFGSGDLVKNSSAFGYSQNEDKTNVSASANFKLPFQFHGDYYVTTGVYGQGSNNIFNFYQSDSWQNNVGGSAGLVWRFAGAKFYDPNRYTKENFDTDTALRETYASEPVYNASKYTDQRLAEIEAMLVEIEKKMRDQSHNIQIAELNNLLSKKNLFEVQKGLIDERTKIREYKAVFNVKKEKMGLEMLTNIEDEQQKQLEQWGNRKYSPLNIYIREKLKEYDSIINPTYGYSFHWLSFNATVSNSSYSFTQEQVDSSARKSFNEGYDIEDTYNHIKTKYSLNYNYTRKAKRFLVFMQSGLSFNLGSVLENNLIDGNPEITGNQLFFTNNDSIYGSLSELESTNLRYGSLDFYGAIFFGEKQTVGFNLTYSHYYNIGSLPANNYNFENHFTCFFGPVFRRVKDDKTSVTFGIDLGWENALYGTQITDDFVTRVRLGIPFTIFEN